MTKLSAERITEILLNSSIPDALYTIPFAGEGGGTTRVESTTDKKGVRRGIQVSLEDGQAFTLWVEVSND